jgi:hypothetical protein
MIGVFSIIFFVLFDEEDELSRISPRFDSLRRWILHRPIRQWRCTGSSTHVTVAALSEDLLCQRGTTADPAFAEVWKELAPHQSPSAAARALMAAPFLSVIFVSFRKRTL